MVEEEPPAIVQAAPAMLEPPPRPAPPDYDIEEDVESILAAPVQVASTSALAELAHAVARERGVGLGRGGITLEEIVREILRSLIKDWLDQNLPYMIERAVSFCCKSSQVVPQNCSHGRFRKCGHSTFFARRLPLPRKRSDYSL
jgi:cell pole-organizing protein PopZ